MNSQEQIDKIRSKAEADIAKINKEAALREVLPVQPRTVHVYPLYESAGSFSYDCKTFAEVLAIVDQFKTMPSYKHSKSGISMRHYPPEQFSSPIDSTELLLSIGTLPKVSFFTEIAGEIWEVYIGFPLNLIGCYRKDNPHARTRFSYQFESKMPLRKIATFAPAEYHGEGSKKSSYCALTKQQLKEWADGSV